VLCNDLKLTILSFKSVEFTPQEYQSLVSMHYNTMKSLFSLFGAPNGLCSSLTESKHITAVKKPYRWSNHNDALNQILIINQRLDNLISYRNAHVQKVYYIIFNINSLSASLYTGSFNTPLMGDQMRKMLHIYEEEGYRDDTNLNEVEDVGEDLE
jgi:hypothetical protein